MGSRGSVPLDETLGDHGTVSGRGTSGDSGGAAYFGLIVLLVAAIVFLGCIISPPSLMDDVDAVQAQISRNMLDSGDWVTARLDGIAYLEKSPLKYWMIALAFKVLGVHDWVARLPVALSAILLCWLTYRMGAWAFSRRAGMYAGLTLATCVGLFLFTRIQIPDVTITATIALALWAFLRALDKEETRPGLWSAVMAAAIGTGLLLKGLIAALFPIAAMLLFLAFTGEWKTRETRRDSWRRLHVFRGILLAVAIAAPWHILATLRNPPYFDFTMHSAPGEYRGFFWFYFFNEHILRFLNLRYPRDYNTVPRLYFWLFHLLWLFPWSVYLPAAIKLNYRSEDRASRMRLLCLCWAGFLLVFFTFSSTQEYYSMPCYPALALLIGSALTEKRAASWIRKGHIALAVIATLALAAIAFILSQVWNLPAPGDISRALTQHPDLYTLSLGHMGDLTMASFAYLRIPLVLAGLGFLAGAIAAFRGKVLGAVVMMILFIHAARLALVVFDPYLASRPLAEALNREPRGTLILDDQYYTFSSVVFYAEAYHGQRVLLLNGRVNNLEYGSYAPDAPRDVFIDDAGFRNRWLSQDLYYICVEKPQVERLEKLVSREALHPVIESGGKFVFRNRG
ncbi:MAG TPA: glycosyltransferase family 39 protein [Bryobacteraceae bacterium]|nr:glycosyltransferase family 39 protein [Bryobacteraceae bacterium]